MYNPRLETFLRVADAGSFNKAAELAYITPTAVIKQINLLENELDVQLFERTHRGLRLTKAGMSLYNDTKYIIQYCKDSVTRAQNAMQEGNHVIRIGTSPMTPAQTLVELWPKIHALCPEIKFQLVPFENTPEKAREILKNLGHNIDVIAGIFDETMLNVRSCAGFEISRQPICCAVSVQHRLASKNRLTIQDLYGEIALTGIKKMEQFYHRIGMPINMQELGIEPTDEQIEKMAESCIHATGGHQGSAKVLYKDDMIKIYQAAQK